MNHSVPVRLAGSVVLLAAILAAPTPARAQTEVLHPHPQGYLDGDAERVVVGQLTDDVHPDVAILQDGDVALLYAPARHQSYLISSGSYSDIALLPGGGPNGADALLAIDAGGLWRMQWNGNELVKDPTPLSGAWSAASSLQVLPTGGGQHVAALDGSPRQVLRGTWSNGSFTSLPTTGLPVTPLAFAAVDFHSHTGVEYAVDDGQGLRVYDGSAALLASLSNVGSAPCLLRLPEGGQDALVWVTDAPGTADPMLSVVRMGSTNAVCEPFLFLAPHRVAGLALGDYFGNGHLDLVTLSGIDSKVRVFFNQHASEPSPTYTFWLPPVGQTFEIDAASVYGASWATGPALAAGDLDGDGDADPVLAGHASTTATMGFYFSDGIDEEAFRPTLPYCTSYTEYPAGDNALASLGFTVIRPSVAAGATHIRVAVWVQPDASSPVPPAAAYASDVAVPGKSQAVELQPSFLVSLQGQEIYHAQFWAVNKQGNQVVQAWPATTWWKMRETLTEDPLCQQDPGSTGGYNDPPNIQPQDPNGRPSP